MLQEDKTELERFIDLVKNKFLLSKIITTPRTFEDLKHDYTNEIAADFYKLNICGNYLDELPKRITKWIDTIDEYLTEFQGKWKYYAHSKRRDLINKYGGDEDDYDENGEIKMNVSDEELYSYHVLNDLVWDECRDIIQDTVPDDVKILLQYIMVDARINITDILRNVNPNQHITSYRIEDGNVVENTANDEVVNKVSRMVDADDICGLFTVVFYAICGVVDYVRSLKKEKIQDDCVDELKKLNDDLHHLLQFELDSLDFYVDFAKKI